VNSPKRLNSSVTKRTLEYTDGQT